MKIAFLAYSFWRKGEESGLRATREFTMKVEKYLVIFEKKIVNRVNGGLTVIDLNKITSLPLRTYKA